VDEPYSPLNLRLVLASFGLVVCTALSIWLFSRGWVVPGVLLALWAAFAVVDIVVIQLRRRARRRAEHGTDHSLFE
jgi:hypothetical protein